MRLYSILVVSLVGWTAFADECFVAKPTATITDDTCGPVDAALTLRDCKTLKETKTFNATMGLDCFETPHKLKLLYNGTKMLVGEVTGFEGDSELILSNTYIDNLERMPAQAQPRMEKSEGCFTMRPLEDINPKTCDPVMAAIQFVDCKHHKPIGLKLEVTTHYACTRHPELRYWYRKMMLVGKLKRTSKGYKVAATYSLIYPSIYGAYDDRNPGSLSENSNQSKVNP